MMTRWDTDALDVTHLLNAQLHGFINKGGIYTANIRR